MQISFSMRDTPITATEFCEIAGIEPSWYYSDLSKGLVSKSCQPFERSQEDFKFSNSLDVIEYVFFKKHLSMWIEETTRKQIAKAAVDEVTYLCDYNCDTPNEIELGDRIIYSDELVDIYSKERLNAFPGIEVELFLRIIFERLAVCWHESVERIEAVVGSGRCW